VAWFAASRLLGETDKLVPYFSSVELSALAKACRGNTFAQRRDAAIVAVFLATGIRLSELTVSGAKIWPGPVTCSDVWP
jgi:site-specific recombinase XerD